MHSEPLLNIRDSCFCNVDRLSNTHFLGQLEPVRIDVSDYYVPGTSVSRDRRRHYSNRAGARNQHILAEDRKIECRMNGVAEGIEYRRNIKIDLPVVTPDIGHRQSDILSKRTGCVNSNTPCVGA